MLSVWTRTCRSDFFLRNAFTAYVTAKSSKTFMWFWDSPGSQNPPMRTLSHTAPHPFLLASLWIITAGLGFIRDFLFHTSTWFTTSLPLLWLDRIASQLCCSPYPVLGPCSSLSASGGNATEPGLSLERTQLNSQSVLTENVSTLDCFNLANQLLFLLIILLWKCQCHFYCIYCKS